MSLRSLYKSRYDSKLKELSRRIEDQLREYLADTLRVDRVSARAKSVDRFIAKAEKQDGGIPKYSEPLVQVQDQIGARIVVFYTSDVDAVSRIVEGYYRTVEARFLIPDSEWEFGYFGKHYIIHMPTDVFGDDFSSDDCPEFFELQIKTLFQHAWSEAEHDLGYKPGTIPLTQDQKRRLAFTAAEAWGADRVFNELFEERARTDGER